MGRKRKDDLEVAAAAKALGAPVKQAKVQAWRDPAEGLLYCEEHRGNAGEEPDLVEPKEGELCAQCGCQLVTGEPGPEKEKPPHRNRRTYEKQVHTMLEGEDHREAVAELTAALDDLTKQELAKKQVMAEWRLVIQEAEGRVKAALARVKEGDLEVVEVEELADYDAGVVTITRLDTGEVLESRPLTEDEAQRTLLGMEDGDSPAHPADEFLEGVADPAKA